MRVYIAGPMQHKEDFNFPAFDAAKQWLEDHGYEAISPADNDRANGFNPTGIAAEDADASKLNFNLREALVWDLAQVSAADRIALLPGWERSKGVAAELALAKALGTPIQPLDLNCFDPDSMHDLPDWPCLDCQTFKARGYASVAASVVDRPFDTPEWPIAKYAGIPELKSADTSWAKAGGEVRTTSATGGQKGVKARRFDLIPVDGMNLLAELYTKGAEKYAEHNWRNGYEWSKSYAAAMRHLTQFWNGEDYDEETGVPHVINVVFHMFALSQFMQDYPEYDDRYRSNDEGK